jgi:hypothetical protein
MNTTATGPDVVYPDSDGKPMADNTLQYAWIVTLKGNLDALFGANPDVYVAFGRPKEHHGSYRVWEEGGIFPQVVFEVLSPGNRAGEMNKKRQFYRTYGAQEYYVIDPEENAVEGWVRDGDTFREVPEMDGFERPRLGIRFSTSGDQLVISHPDGRPFQTFQEIIDRAAAAERQKQENERLRALLRAAGIDPDAANPS